MKNFMNELKVLVGRSDARAIFVFVTIVLYIISAGAPDAGGGIGL
jgi:hypothetical protein